jgi:hypothetical protein
MEWTVGPVQNTMDDTRNFSGSGFVIRDRQSRPVASFGYASRSEAEEARTHMVAVLANALSVTGYA